MLTDIQRLNNRADIASPIYLIEDGIERELNACYQVDDVGPFEDHGRRGAYMERHAVLIGAWDDDGVMTVDYLVAKVGLDVVRKWEAGAVQ